MKKYYLITAFVCCWMLGMGHTSNAEIMGDYLGVLSCVGCHAKESLTWRDTKHGHAWADLLHQGPEKQSIPECFKCHVVAYNDDGGFIDMDLTPELNNVQCEACHGPGRSHVESGGKKELIIGVPNEETCRVCHTKGQDKNFNFEEKMKKISHKRLQSRSKK